MATRYEAALERLRAAEREYEAACKEVRDVEFDLFRKELSVLLLKHGVKLNVNLRGTRYMIEVSRTIGRAEVVLGVLDNPHD